MTYPVGIEVKDSNDSFEIVLKIPKSLPNIEQRLHLVGRAKLDFDRLLAYLDKNPDFQKGIMKDVLESIKGSSTKTIFEWNMIKNIYQAINHFRSSSKH